jgi:type II secretory pathway predicted ATPase ExeA
LRGSIKPLSIFEINKYIRFRLKQAGAENVNLFDNGAVKLIGQVSHGIPRVINNICDNAMLYGYASGSEVITRDIIEEVIAALNLAPGNVNNNSSQGFGGEISSGF